MYKLLVLLAAIMFSGICAAEADQKPSQRLHELQQKLSAQSTPVIFGAETNACGGAPLPLTPVGPSVSATWHRGSNDTFTATGWRIPCPSGDSMVVLKIVPPSGHEPFLCGGSLTLLQGGLQTDRFAFLSDPLDPFSTFCGDILVPLTFAIVPTRYTPGNFNFDQRLTIDHDGGSAGHESIDLFAYDPSDYGAPPSGGVIIDSGFTGSWYNPDQSGHGFSIEVISGGMLAYWYVFDDAGKPSWIIAQGAIHGDTATLDAVLSLGGFFPPDFDSGDVTRIPWGAITFTFTDCNHGHVSWLTDVPGYSDGDLDIARLTLPDGLTCSN